MEQYRKSASQPVAQVSRVGFLGYNEVSVSERRKMGLKDRTDRRKKRMVAHVSRGFDEAERWDLEYWQAMTPEERLSALVAIRRDVEKVRFARDRDPDAPTREPR